MNQDKAQQMIDQVDDTIHKLETGKLMTEQQVEDEIRRRLEIQQRMLEYKFKTALRKVSGVYRLPLEAEQLLERIKEEVKP